MKRRGGETEEGPSNKVIFYDGSILQEEISSRGC